jgi:hypothetical protein
MIEILYLNFSIERKKVIIKKIGKNAKAGLI